MKVKEITKRGEVRYLVDGKVNGTRQRMFFDTKPQAERWLKVEQQDTTCQNWWLNLSNGDRADMMNAFERFNTEGAPPQKWNSFLTMTLSEKMTSQATG